MFAELREDWQEIRKRLEAESYEDTLSWSIGNVICRLGLDFHKTLYFYYQLPDGAIVWNCSWKNLKSVILPQDDSVVLMVEPIPGVEMGVVFYKDRTPLLGGPPHIKTPA